MPSATKAVSMASGAVQQYAQDVLHRPCPTYCAGSACKLYRVFTVSRGYRMWSRQTGSRFRNPSEPAVVIVQHVWSVSVQALVPDARHLLASRSSTPCHYTQTCTSYRRDQTVEDWFMPPLMGAFFTLDVTTIHITYVQTKLTEFMQARPSFLQLLQLKQLSKRKTLE